MDAPIAVVLGAGGTLGTAIAGRLAALGCRVVGVGRSATPPESLLAAVPDVSWCAADLHDDSIADALRPFLDGPVRMVVQASGLESAGSLESLDPNALGRAIDGKLGGLLRVLAVAAARLSSGSRIVALGGHYGVEPSPHAPLAGVTNAALANLVRQLADVWGPKGVTVHLVAPGPVESDRMDRIAGAAARREGVDPESVLDRYRSQSPLGRLTTAQEVAWAVGLLLDPEAAAMHGSTLWLDAGRRRGIG